LLPASTEAGGVPLITGALLTAALFLALKAGALAIARMSISNRLASPVCNLWEVDRYLLKVYCINSSSDLATSLC
jgi:hypothetical protein